MEGESAEENLFSFKIKTHTVGWVRLISTPIPVCVLYCTVFGRVFFSIQTYEEFIVVNIRNLTVPKRDFLSVKYIGKGLLFLYVLKICFITIFAINNLSIFLFLCVDRFDLFVFQHERMVLQRPLYRI